MPETGTVTNWTDFYAQQLIRSKDWFKLKAPLWDAIDEITDAEVVSQRGVRFFYQKTQAGGHSLPSLSQPDNNRFISSQSDSMWAVPQLYTIPLVLDLLLIQDAGGNNGPKKANAMFTIQDIIKQTTGAAAQHQDFFACGNGSDAMAYAASSLTVVGSGQTLTCSTAAASDPGHTKGAVRLKQNQYYQSYDTSTGLPEGTILVTSANNKTTATVTLLSGVVTSGNPICDVGGYNAAPMGYTGLINSNNRIMQGRDTSVDTILNCPAVSLGSTKFTVSDRETVKTQLVVLDMDDGMRSGLTNIVTPGLMSDLRKQGYGFHRTEGDAPVVDISKIYKDVDGTRIMEIADAEEDYSTFFKSNLQKHTELPFGDINPDDLQWRNLPGVNSTGSRNFYRMFGTSWSLAITDTMACSLVKGASTSGIVTQSSVGLGN
jgi:hypothetical protein